MSTTTTMRWRKMRSTAAVLPDPNKAYRSHNDVSLTMSHQAASCGLPVSKSSNDRARESLFARHHKAVQDRQRQIAQEERRYIYRGEGQQEGRTFYTGSLCIVPTMSGSNRRPATQAVWWWGLGILHALCRWPKSFAALICENSSYLRVTR